MEWKQAEYEPMYYAEAGFMTLEVWGIRNDTWSVIVPLPAKRIRESGFPTPALAQARALAIYIEALRSELAAAETLEAEQRGQEHPHDPS